MQNAPRSILLVDERDSSWEDNNPRFRVYIQTSRARDESSTTETYDLSGYDFPAASEWARKRAGSDRKFAIALVLDDECRERANPGTGRGLIWLEGRDLNSDV